MTFPTAEEIRAALEENDEEPEGQARNARAEQLVTQAESTGERDLLVEALLNLVSAYNFSSERDKSFVPFARLLRMWDEQPGDFDTWTTYQLHWIFKWVAGGMIDQPDIPLESVREWQAQMAQRYRLAGHSERAVRQSEFTIARTVGDIPAAERAFAAWIAADRDDMSDCHACELQQQGLWRAHRGDDDEALRLWQPVLEGKHTCLHEPGTVLASSLLPLVRLGRTAEARSNHIRGYRMVRGEESMRDSVAHHLAFCALTGNEPRGLEILAEQGGHWDQSGTPMTYLSWTGGVAVLMRRLTELGHAGMDVPGPPGHEWTAVKLLEHAADETLAVAARFDKRNGTSAVSDEARTLMGRRPLVERLPLGLRAAPLKKAAAEAPQQAASDAQDSENPAAPDADAPAAAADAPAAPSSGSGAASPRALLAEARRLSETGHPAAADAWQRLEEAVTRTGTTLSGADRAELLDHSAMSLARTDPAAGAEQFAEAAALFTKAGDQGQSVACRARAALATAFAGQPDEALQTLASLCGEAVSMHSAGRVGTKHATAVLLSRTRVRLLLLDEDEDPERAGAELDTELADLIAFALPHRSESAVLARIADATESRGRLAAALGDATGAAEHFAEAARLYQESDRPWQATGPELLLAQGLLETGDAEKAVSVVRGALEDPQRAEVRSAEETVDLHITLADIYAAQEQAEDEVGQLLDAAHCADAAGDGAGAGAYIRLRLGGAYLALGRMEEAAEVLESAMEALTAGHAESDVVQARWWLGQALSGMEEDRAAAEQFLLAAQIAEGWEDQRDHAMLAHLAGDTLKKAGLGDEAMEAYERAGELWRSLGETPALARALRSRAWIAVAAPPAEGEESVGVVATAAATKAVELMAAAMREVESALHSAQDARARLMLQLELGQTYRQTADLFLATTDGPPDEEQDSPEQYAVNRAAYEQAVACTDHSVTILKGCDAAGLEERTSAELSAAWLELNLGRRESAARRARSVLDAYANADAAGEDGPDDTESVAATRVREANSILAGTGEAAHRVDTPPA
jgi:tetratricopeptide (TPR) repeat protein